MEGKVRFAFIAAEEHKQDLVSHFSHEGFVVLKKMPGESALRSEGLVYSR